MLRPRLRALADRVLPGHPAADVCCDHALLASALVSEGIVPAAIGVDLRLPQRAVSSVPVGVELRQGDGLLALVSGEVATVVIAGVGAQAAARILAAGRGALAGVRRIVLQPSVSGFPGLGRLRQQLMDLGWGLADECLVLDRGRLYVVLVAERACWTSTFAPADRELGPILRQGSHLHWDQWLESERACAVRICAARPGPTLRRQYLSLIDACRGADT